MKFFLDYCKGILIGCGAILPGISSGVFCVIFGIYEKLLDKLAKMDFEIYYITLYLKDEEEFTKRLNREGKTKVKFTEFNKNSSSNQQKEYLKLADEIKQKYPNVNVVNIDNSRELKVVEKELQELLKWKE